MLTRALLQDPRQDTQSAQWSIWWPNGIPDKRSNCCDLPPKSNGQEYSRRSSTLNVWLNMEVTGGQNDKFLTIALRGTFNAVRVSDHLIDLANFGIGTCSSSNIRTVPIFRNVHGLTQAVQTSYGHPGADSSLWKPANVLYNMEES